MSHGDFVGLCYVKDEGHEWELGGLTVDPKVQAKGFGTTLARVAIAHTMAFSEPWTYGQEVIAYVHQANDDPRKLLNKLGFAYASSIEVPAEIRTGLNEAERGRKDRGRQVSVHARRTEATR